jgi:hypothetical protein
LIHVNRRDAVGNFDATRGFATHPRDKSRTRPARTCKHRGNPFPVRIGRRSTTGAADPIRPADHCEEFTDPPGRFVKYSPRAIW